MANIGGMYDPNAEPEAPREFSLIPPGNYTVQIVDSMIVGTRSGDGQMLKLTMDIMEGEHAGRKIWDNLNLVNPNAQAVEIAQRALNQITHATGKLGATDSEELHFIPMIAVVKVEPGKNGYGPSNKVSGYKAYGGGATAAMPPPANASHAGPAARPAPQMSRQAPPPVAKQATATPPWRR